MDCYYTMGSCRQYGSSVSTEYDDPWYCRDEEEVDEE